MQIEVTIGGLFLLVNDPTRNAVHVIAPAMAGHAHMGHPAHYTNLVHPGASGRAFDALDGFALDLGAYFGVAPAPTVIDRSILDIRDVDASLPPFPRAVLDSAHASKAAQITLTGGTITPVRAECCRLRSPDRSDDNPDRMVAAQVRWTADATTVEARWIQSSALHHTGTRPIKGPESTVRLGLVNAVADVMTYTLDDLEVGEGADFSHFTALYGFWDSKSTKAPFPCESQYPSQCVTVQVSAEA